MTRWVVLPVLLPVLLGVATLPLAPRVRASGRLLSVGLALNLGVCLWLLGRVAGAADAVGGTLASQMGGWAAPLGISLVADATSALLLCSTALVAFCGHLYAVAALPREAQRRYFHPMFAFLVAGVNLSFLTGDLFNLFVAFEVMLMASYGLVVLGAGRVQLAQAYKYVVLNLLASTLFVTAAGLVYGMFGTLNVADLCRLLSAEGFEPPPGFAAVSVTLLVVFALKAGAFPLWFWLPDVYPTLPTPTLAVFGGVLTKVGVYTLARLFPAAFGAGHAADAVGPLLGLTAGATMLVPALMAVAYPRVRMVLCMMILTGVGFGLTGVAVGTAGSLAGTVFYSVQSMLLVSAGFLLCGRLEAAAGTDRVRGAGGLHRGHPWLAVGMLAVLLALVGLPPLSGFYGKFAIVQEALSGGRWVLAVVALLTGAVSLLAALRAWAGVFWVFPEEEPAADAAARSPRSAPPAPGACGWRRALALALLLGAAGWVSLQPEPLLSVARRAGAGLADPSAYVRAVLPADPGVVDVAPVPPPKIDAPAGGEAH